jgi:glycosyltransferase involved in cell wall biosynthesis
MKSSRIVFVVDKKYSPLWEAANQHLAFGDVLVVSASEFYSPSALCRYISTLNPEVLIFSWRTALVSLYKNFWASRKLRSMNSKILLLIPDCMGRDDPKTKILESWMFKKIDLLLVTSEELVTFYKAENPNLNLGILHDRPNLDLIKLMNDKNEIANNLKTDFIWIGNSRWGHRQGYKDHKGLNRYILPAFKQYQIQQPNSSLEIIDSAQIRLPNEVVMSKIKNANCLLVASDSEGTCLPLLESAGLGTPLVTFDTGIASELLVGELRILIADRSIKSLITKMSYAINNKSELSKKLQIRFQEYIDSTQDEFTQILYRISGVSAKNISVGLQLFSVIWTSRWLRFKLNN